MRLFHFPSLLVMQHQEGGIKGVLDALLERERGGGHLMHLDSNTRLDTDRQTGR